jgi:ABC-type uncharacterized transport system substrate-binding protein
MLMARRTFLGLLAGGLAAALTAKGAARDSERLPVIGILHPGPAPNSFSVNTIVNGLGDLGYVNGQTVTIKLRSADGNPDRLPELATELVKQGIDVLYAVGPAAVRAALDVAKGIPIVVMDLETDPVQVGWARSLARPGGNVTGMFLDLPSLAGKWLELLREAAPGIRRIGVLWDSTTGTSQMQAARATGQRLGLDLQVVEFRNSDDLAAALRGGVRAGIKGLVALTSPITDRNSELLADFTVKNQLPGISFSRMFVRAGGLLSYGPDLGNLWHRAATFADRILKGAKPGDLPIEQPTKFDMWLNLKTAKALGLTIPRSLLVRADEVIQ